MCCSPYAHDAYAGECGKVHIDTIHAEHHIEMAHHDELLVDRSEQRRRIGTFLITCAPRVEHLLLCFSAPEEQHATRRVSTYYLRHHLFHFLRRIYLLFIYSERRNAYPLLEYLLLTYFLRNESQIATRSREHRLEVEFYGIT